MSPIPVALSTSCMGETVTDTVRFVNLLNECGVKYVEMDYRLNRQRFDRLKQALKENDIAVVSLHNYCPHPTVIPKASPSGDYFKLSALDPEERKQAVDWTIRTLEHAHDLEARCVVLHCGLVEMAHQCMDILRIFQMQGPDAQDLKIMVSGMLATRETHKGPYLDALMFSLDQLVAAAGKYHVTLGLENRYFYHELPDYGEMAHILSAFEGAPIGYWHDVGHGRAQELLGIAPANQWLIAFGPYLKGMHVHDARGLSDHLAPGTGELDFSVVLSQLNENRPAVLELAPGTNEEDVNKGIRLIQAMCEAENKPSS